MQNARKICEDIWWLGASDRRLALFENVYPVPDGMAYNNYLIEDEKTCLVDGIDRAVTDQFLENLAYALAGRDLDYMIVQHMEPDHCAVIPTLLKKYPAMTIVASAKALQMIAQFYALDVSGRSLVIKEKDSLSLGKHTLTFYAAPMVHWPEVMVTVDETAHALFSADAFGSFGSLGGNLFADEVEWERDHAQEARRYYTNIVGKYGAQTTALLGKLEGQTLAYLLPLHGYLWRKDLAQIIDRTAAWAAYEPEVESAAVFFGSVYGHTGNAAEILAGLLAERGLRDVKVYDVSKTPVSELVSAAFAYRGLVFACSTYNAEIFDPMHSFLTDLKNHGLCRRTVGLVENGSWALSAGKKMTELLSAMKEMTILEPLVSVKSAVNEESYEGLVALADALTGDLLKRPARS